MGRNGSQTADDERQKTFVNGFAGAHRTRVQPVRVYVLQTAKTFRPLCGKRVKMMALPRNYLVLVKYLVSSLGVECDLIVVLRSQFFKYLSETFYRHVSEYLQPAHSENKRSNKKYWSIILQKRLKKKIKAYCGWPGHIFAASSGPRSLQKKLAIYILVCHPLPLFMAVSIISNM